MAYLIEEENGEYIWLKWERIESYVKNFGAGAYIKQGVLVFHLRHSGKEEHETFERIVEYVHSLPKWDKTRYYMDNAGSGRYELVDATTGLCVSHEHPEIYEKLGIGRNADKQNAIADESPNWKRT